MMQVEFITEAKYQSFHAQVKVSDFKVMILLGTSIVSYSDFNICQIVLIYIYIYFKMWEINLF